MSWPGVMLLPEIVRATPDQTPPARPTLTIPKHGRGRLAPPWNSETAPKGNKGKRWKWRRKKRSKPAGALWPHQFRQLRAKLLQSHAAAIVEQMLLEKLLPTRHALATVERGLCCHCRATLRGDELPLFVGSVCLGWSHHQCLAPAMQRIVIEARQELAKALTVVGRGVGSTPQSKR